MTEFNNKNSNEENEDFFKHSKKLLSLSRYNYIGKEQAEQMEKEGEGIWATIKECAKALNVHENTIRKKIKEKKFYVTFSKKQTKHGFYSLLIWITNPIIIKKIIENRYKKQKKELLSLIVTKSQLSNMHEQKIIDEGIFSNLLKEENNKFEMEIDIPQKLMKKLLKHLKILKIKPFTKYKI